MHKHRLAHSLYTRTYTHTHTVKEAQAPRVHIHTIIGSIPVIRGIQRAYIHKYIHIHIHTQLKKRRPTDTPLASTFTPSLVRSRSLEASKEHTPPDQPLAQSTTGDEINREKVVLTPQDHVWGSTKMGSRGTPDYMVRTVIYICVCVCVCVCVL